MPLKAYGKIDSSVGVFKQILKIFDFQYLRHIP